MIFRILTIGDGDFTFSLALLRAYCSSSSSSCSSGQRQDRDRDRDHDAGQIPQCSLKIHVTVSTLCKTKDELCKTYGTNQIEDNINEILSYKNNSTQNNDNIDDVVRIVYDVDATKLHLQRDKLLLFTTGSSVDNSKLFDIVMFNHPHLGITNTGNVSTIQKEKNHATRHYMLLSHYFYSAKHVIKPNTGMIHVCLCQKQAITWNLYNAATCTNKDGDIRQISHETANNSDTGSSSTCNANDQLLKKGIPTTIPLHKWLTIGLQLRRQEEAYENREHGETLSSAPSLIMPRLSLVINETSTSNNNMKKAAAPRKYRNGKLGSKHFLGKYGYQHRRTYENIGGDNGRFSKNTIDVTESYNYVWNYKPKMSQQQQQQQQPQNGNVKNCKSNSSLRCSVCNMVFSTEEAFCKHQKDPALPYENVITATSPVCEESDTNISPSNKQKRKARELSNGDSNSNNNHHNGKNNPGISPPMNNKSNIDDDSNLVVVDDTVITEEYDGKRLRWYLRQPSSLVQRQQKLSRKQCDNLIKNGCISINDEIAYDSSRILHINDIIKILTNYDNGNNNNKNGNFCNGDGKNHSDLNKKLILSMATNSKEKNDSAAATSSSFSSGDNCTDVVPSPAEVRLIREVENSITGNCLVVVYKPVGIRCVGSFSSDTLEMIVSNKLLGYNNNDNSYQYKSLTKLDTGCSGLCVLRKQKQKQRNNKQEQHLKEESDEHNTENKTLLSNSQTKTNDNHNHNTGVSQVYTALVHGCWVKNKHKRKKKTKEATTSTLSLSSLSSPNICLDEIHYIEKTKLWKNRQNSQQNDINETTTFTTTTETNSTITGFTMNDKHRGREDDDEDDNDDDSDRPTIKGVNNKSNYKVIVQFVEETANNNVDNANNSTSSTSAASQVDFFRLSTLRIITDPSLAYTSGLCSSICCMLRNIGFPVVNDRFCKREYMTLPRSIRNKIKGKLCIGCYEVKIQNNNDDDDGAIVVGKNEEDADVLSSSLVPPVSSRRTSANTPISDGITASSVSIDIPDRLSALYWERHLERGRMERTAILK